EHFQAAIAGAAATLLREVIVRHGPASFLFADDVIVHDERGAPFVGYVRTWSPRVDLVACVAEHPSWEAERGLMAVVAVGHEHRIRAAAAEIEERLQHAARAVVFPVARMGMFAMLIRAAGSTKGTAVEWLARFHGCALSDVVVVGDWLNDVPMFEVAGRSFVMGQAPPSVKATATDALLANCFR